MAPVGADVSLPRKPHVHAQRQRARGTETSESQRGREAQIRKPGGADIRPQSVFRSAVVD